MYALRTRPPVTIADPLDLHVLGLPLAFILSQDQTLRKEDFDIRSFTDYFSLKLRPKKLSVFTTL